MNAFAGPIGFLIPFLSYFLFINTKRFFESKKGLKKAFRMGYEQGLIYGAAASKHINFVTVEANGGLMTRAIDMTVHYPRGMNL